MPQQLMEQQKTQLVVRSPLSVDGFVSIYFSSPDGRLLNEDTFSVQLLDTTEHLRSFRKAELKEYAFLEKSTMPSYKDRLTAQELSDVVGYLTSLKGL